MPDMPENDLLGRPIEGTDAQMLRLYRELKALAAQPGLPPCTERNVKKALACMWQIVTDLNLEYEQLYDVGV